MWLFSYNIISNPENVNPFVGLNPLLMCYIAAMSIIKVLERFDSIHFSFHFYIFSLIHKALVNI